MDRSDKVSLWYVALIINTRFRFFFLFKKKQLLSAFNVTLRGDNWILLAHRP